MARDGPTGEVPVANPILEDPIVDDERIRVAGGKASQAANPAPAAAATMTAAATPRCLRTRSVRTAKGPGRRAVLVRILWTTTGRAMFLTVCLPR